MKSILNFLLGICILIPLVNYGQQAIKPNEFKIGMFGFEYMNVGSMDAWGYLGSFRAHNALITSTGHLTSQLNVLKEDGFDVVTDYSPQTWMYSGVYIKSLVELVQLNGLQIHLNASDWKVPTGTFYDTNYPTTYANATGMVNIYDNYNQLHNGQPHPDRNNQYYMWKAHPDYVNDFANVYSLTNLQDVIWGYHITEESTSIHPKNPTNGPIQWDSETEAAFMQTPVANVEAAITKFSDLKTQYNILQNKQKLVVMEANHHQGINDNTDFSGWNDWALYDSDPNNDWAAGRWYSNPQDYVKISNPNGVFFEGSYTIFNQNGWETEIYTNISQNYFHYLGPFTSIDYAKDYYNEIHKVIHIAYTSLGSEFENVFHSNTNVPNANWLWFQAYTSIIHGAKGIWFWQLSDAWAANEKPTNWNSMPDRYERSNFPETYKNYTSHLAQELRFLVDKNIISTDANTIIATKTDQADEYCIVPPASTYIPTTLSTEKQTENYGLRYTIRTNGTETYVIITNPLPVSFTTSLDFSNTSNTIIKNSTGVDVLFETNQLSVTDPLYKVNRESNIDLTNLTVGNSFNIPYNSGTKQLSLAFGPMDVKVLKFVSTPPNYDNGWNLTWSNFGTGWIGGHKLQENDLYYTGDFDGDGAEELLCIGKGYSGSDWITMLKFENDGWTWKWSNYGSSTPGNGIYDYRDNLIVGDYDGDGKDELFGGITVGTSKITSLFKFTGSDWIKPWTRSNYLISQYIGKIYVGNFDGVVKDELFGIKLSDGTSRMFRWSGTDFVSIWSNSQYPTINPYVSNMIVGDFDGDNKDELLGTSGSWSTLFHYESSNWQWGWSNYGSNSIGGLSTPFLSTDKILIDNLDGDNKDELFYVQTSNNAGWAVSQDMVLNPDWSWSWSWNWTANSEYAVPFIDDWSLSSNVASITKYFLIKAVANEPSYLFVMRKFDGYNPCDNFIVNMYQPTQSNFRITNQTLVTNENLISNISNSENENNFILYPNPSSGKIQIHSENLVINGVEIFDIRGQLVFKNSYGLENDIQINLSDKPNGIYFVKIHTAEKIFYQKIIKQ